MRHIPFPRGQDCRRNPKPSDNEQKNRARKDADRLAFYGSCRFIPAHLWAADKDCNPRQKRRSV